MATAELDPKKALALNTRGVSARIRFLQRERVCCHAELLELSTKPSSELSEMVFTPGGLFLSLSKTCWFS
ncbi:hypothetical protein Nmel_000822 [Mimus melanotis]